MHLALLHEGRPALLRVEGPAKAPVALFFHPFPLHADAGEEMLMACAASGLCAAAIDAPGFGGTPPLGQPLSMDRLAGLGGGTLGAPWVGRGVRPSWGARWVDTRPWHSRESIPSEWRRRC